jgi:hypothetical protein
LEKSKAEREIEFICSIIEDSRRTLTDNGLPLIIWGALSVLGTLLTYGAIALSRFDAIPWIWIGFGVSGSTGTVLALRYKKRDRVKSLTGIIYTGVWLGMAGCDIILWLCLWCAGIRDLRLFLAVAACGLGLAYLISSTITRNRFIFTLSFAWWAGSIVMVLLPERYAPMILAGLVLTCELLPGIILFTRKRI